MIKTPIQRDIHIVQTKWNENFHFESIVNDHTVHFDKLNEHNGCNQGPRPKPMILAAAGSCVGMEISALSRKMRISPSAILITISGVLSDSIPKIYTSVHIVFNICIPSAEETKMKRSIDLALTRYCGVITMIKKFAELSYEVKFK